jgi:Zn-dependent metalloprotease
MNATQTSTTLYVQDPCFGTGVMLPGDGVTGACGTPERPDGTDRTIVTPGFWVGDANYRNTATPKVMTFSNGSSTGDGTLGSTSAATVGADAYASLYSSFRYLYVMHDRQGLDRNNGPAVRAVVHHPMGANAEWSTRYNAVLIGHGDANHYDLASLDVMAHELGHGLSAYGPTLQYGTNPESAKLAEATANMFAMLVSGDHLELDVVPYRIGEMTSRTGAPGDTFTYMDDPVQKSAAVCYDPGNAALENHRGAGPGNHMFYLLVYGGHSKCNGSLVQSIGFAAAEKIWYDAFHNLQPLATYSQLRAQFVASAMALADGPANVAVASTISAFDAVNVQ